MDAEEFRKCGKEMVDYVADYLENIRDRYPLTDVKPGYMRQMIPDKAPENGEAWDEVFGDIEKVIMPGVTHWMSPQFHAYFPTGQSYPAMCADMLSGAIASIGFTWASNPACTELEVIMMDWLGKALDLPKEFLFESGGTGGGVIQATASEATLVALLSARTQFIRKLRKDYPNEEDGVIISKLVAYTSNQSHSSVERAGLIGAVKMNMIECNEKCQLDVNRLQSAIEADKKKGLIPFFVCATVGTTPSCAFDDLMEIGPLCEREGVWMHIDAAYAGSAFLCPEFRPLLNGVEYAQSYNFNAHKWMKVNFDCSCMWVKNSRDVSEAFEVDPLYLKHENQGVMPDYRHWHMPLGRRFRSLKLWFVLRMYGIKGLQSCIRKDIGLAQTFESYVLRDPKFEIFGEVVLGLVCFRLKGSNERNEKLLKLINDDRRIHLVPSKVRETYFLRFAICSNKCEHYDIDFAWKVISELAPMAPELAPKAGN